MPNPPATRLIVFTRFPEPGTTKTRLVPPLGADGAAELQRRMTRRVLDVARSWAEPGSEIDRLMIENFLTTLAGIAMSIASRNLQGESEGGI